MYLRHDIIHTMFPYLTKKNVVIIHKGVELRMPLILRWKHVQSHMSRAELLENSFRVESCCQVFFNQ